MSDESDPRVYFAAERTLPAWLRTGLTVIGLGFLVARFGLFLQMVRRPSDPQPAPLESTVIGVGLVILGAVMIAAAAWQHRRFCNGPAGAERPSRYWLSLGIWSSALIAAAGLALALYLVWSTGRN
jgi:putative membrane protein